MAEDTDGERDLGEVRDLGQVKKTERRTVEEMDIITMTWVG